MGIRFRCHHCEYELHVKDFQAGKRGRCPECKGKFRIPEADAATSLALDEEAISATSQPQQAVQTPDSKLAKTAQQRPAPSKAASHPKLPARTKPDTPRPASEADAGEADHKLAPDRPAQDTTLESQFLPQVLRESPESTWYVRPPSGGQFGPASNDIFLGWMADHRVAHDALVWKDGWPEWLVAGQVFEDYFGPDLAATAGSQANLPITTSDGASGGSTAQEPSSAQPTLSERNRSLRKQRRKRNYMIMLAVLSVLSVVLIVALVVVLMMQDLP